MRHLVAKTGQIHLGGPEMTAHAIFKHRQHAPQIQPVGIGQIGHLGQMLLPDDTEIGGLPRFGSHVNDAQPLVLPENVFPRWMAERAIGGFQGAVVSHA